jgi:hypothetical protein
MKRILNILCLIGMVIGASCCFNPPDFSDVPSIEFEDIRFKEVPGTSTPDSIFLIIDFQDGDGDIGIDGMETAPPFNENWFFLKDPNEGTDCENGVTSPCHKVSFYDDSEKENYVTYSLRRTSINYDTLPEYIAPYDCSNYLILRDDTNKPIDTFYIEPNPRYYNIFVELEVKNNDGTYYKFEYPGCELNALNGRIPILAKDKDISVKLPLDGTITYKIVSNALQQLSGKTLRFKFWILDRAGHASNIQFTRDFP